MKQKRFLSLILAVCLMLALFPISPAHAANTAFSDVPSTKWFFPYVTYAAENGLMNGTGGGKFNPQGTLSRAMFVTILGRLDGVNTARYAGSTFSDVPLGQYYTPYVQWASQCGITNGVGGGRFRPNAYVTRQDMAVMIARYLSLEHLTLPPASNHTDPFYDIHLAADYALDGLELMRITGIIEGSNGYFRPRNNATRAEAATIFTRLDQALSVPASTHAKPVARGAYGTQTTGYSVTSLHISGPEVFVRICTDAACTLVVQITREGSTNATIYCRRVGSNLQMDEVSLSLPEAPEGTFFVSAVLRDDNGADLSNTFTEIAYTRAYQQFAALTPESRRFAGREVLDFDDDPLNNAVQTDNFGVLATGVARIETASLTISETSCTYAAAKVPAVGDRLYLLGPDGEAALVQVKSVRDNRNGTITVTQNPNTALPDFYEVLKLSIGTGNTSSKGTDTLFTHTYNFKKELGKESSISGSLTAQVDAEIRYDAVLFGPDELYLSLSCTATVDGALDLAYTYSGQTEFPLVRTHRVPVGQTGLTLDLGPVNLIVDYGFAASANAKLHATTTSGYVYQTGQGIQRKNAASASLETSAMAQGNVNLSLQCSAGIGFVNDMLYAHALLTPKLCIFAQTAEHKSEAQAKQDGDESLHACALCIAGDLSLDLGLEGELGFRLTEKLQKKFTLPSQKKTFDLGSFYLSLMHESRADTLGWDSGPHFGLGHCPNLRYRWEITTLDAQKQPVEGKTVTITPTNPSRPSGPSPYLCYLLDGSYIASASFDGTQSNAPVVVRGAAGRQVISAPVATVHGTVTDQTTGKPLSNTTVTLSCAGMTRTTSTDSKGSYTFSLVPLGSYTMSAECSGYESAFVSISLTKPDATVTKDLRLKPNAPYLNAYAEILRQNIQSSGRFYLIYINNDDIPELVICHGYSHSSTSDVYTWQNGSIFVGNFGDSGILYFAEKTGRLVSSYWINQVGGGEEFYFLRADGTVENYAHFLHRIADPERHIAESFEMNGRVVSQAQWKAQNTAAWNAYPFVEVNYGNGFDITSKNVNKFLSDSSAFLFRP